MKVFSTVRRAAVMAAIFFCLAAIAVPPISAANLEADFAAAAYDVMPRLEFGPEEAEQAELVGDLQELYASQPNFAAKVFATLRQATDENGQKILGAGEFKRLKNYRTLGDEDKAKIRGALARAIKVRSGQVGGPVFSMVERQENGADSPLEMIETDLKLAKSLALPDSVDAPFLGRRLKEKFGRTAPLIPGRLKELRRQTLESRLNDIADGLGSSVVSASLDEQNSLLAEDVVAAYLRQEWGGKDNIHQIVYPWIENGDRYVLVRVYDASPEKLKDIPVKINITLYETHFSAKVLVQSYEGGPLIGLNGERVDAAVYDALKAQMELLRMDFEPGIGAQMKRGGKMAKACAKNYRAMMKIWTEVLESGVLPTSEQARQMLDLTGPFSEVLADSGSERSKYLDDLIYILDNLPPF